MKTNTDLPQMTGKLYYSTESEIAGEGFFLNRTEYVRNVIDSFISVLPLEI